MISTKGNNRLTDVCADCSSLDPSWAIVNRGLLVCDECCSIHSSLGRHISQVKSLKKSHWNISQLNMVNALNSGGVNSLWEHSLPDCKSRKKPTPKDPLHPTKADFITSKHRDLLFVLKSEDSEEELNMQLHASVRTTNLETSLRLLAQGADPNFFHQEKGTSVLHVAAKVGQALQVELLVAHGADLLARDALGNTPAQLARAGGHREIQMRLIELVYEVTDRLTYFLTRRRPEHRTGQHFIAPLLHDCIVPPQRVQNSFLKLKMMPNAQFENLVCDVYDEVDRRETETIWLSSAASLHYKSVRFLPVNPYLSPVRNQGRQKLGRLSPGEFSALVFDVLEEARRRQAAPGRGLKDDDEPLYDSVASDDDYATAEQLAIMVAQNSRGLPLTLSEPAKCSTAQAETTVVHETHYLKDKVREMEKRESQLVQQMHRLSSKLKEIGQENRDLRSALQTSVHQSVPEPVMDLKLPSQNQRPVSMYEKRESSNRTSSMPPSDEVAHRTTQLTQRIQELWSALRPPESNFVYVACAERIRVAVAELCAIFPQNVSDPVISSALFHLNTSTLSLENECAELEKRAELVRTSAYNIADAMRKIVTRCTPPQS